jgi:hypothetical protein
MQFNQWIKATWCRELKLVTPAIPQPRSQQTSATIAVRGSMIDYVATGARLEHVQRAIGLK